MLSRSANLRGGGVLSHPGGFEEKDLDSPNSHGLATSFARVSPQTKQEAREGLVVLRLLSSWINNTETFHGENELGAGGLIGCLALPGNRPRGRRSANATIAAISANADQ